MCEPGDFTGYQQARGPALKSCTNVVNAAALRRIRNRALGSIVASEAAERVRDFFRGGLDAAAAAYCTAKGARDCCVNT